MEAKGDTMEELAAVLEQFGNNALWGVILYQVLEIVKILGCFTFAAYLLKKAWPAIKEAILS